VALRAAATASEEAPAPWDGGGELARPGPGRGFRQVDLDPYGGVTRVLVIGRDDLTGTVAGPCVIEEQAATTLVLPGQTAHRDALANLIIEEGP
jgi:hypothetical protein